MILYFAILLGLVCISIGIRNIYVLKFRLKLIDKIFSTENWMINRKALNEVTYNKMILMFWKPLKPEAWWKDTSFLK